MIGFVLRFLGYFVLGLLAVLSGAGVVAALGVALVILLPLSFVVVLYAVIRLICSTLHSAVFDLAIKRLGPSR